jgi:tRNA-Thr(GGU) m(6)t(6)A37 methyltransferase TsaA
MPDCNTEASARSSLRYTPIGVIRSPFAAPEGMPIQTIAAQGVAGSIELDPLYREGLQDIKGFSHLILIYHSHPIQGSSLTVTPFLDDQPHGIFATRAPKRPNPIGLSIVQLMRVDATTLYIQDVDVVDGTPLLDMKPYVPAFDVREGVSIGWFAKNVDQTSRNRADHRFR